MRRGKPAEPLFDAVWPPRCPGKAAWGDIVFAHADLRVLVARTGEGLVCHVGIFRRDRDLERTQDARRRHRRGGDPRSLQPPRLCQHRARRRDPDPERRSSIDFALLFCEPHNAPFYQATRLEAVRRRNLCRATQRADPLRRRSRPMSSTSSARRDEGAIDLCGLPWYGSRPLGTERIRMP